jgi:cell division septation protein DedD
MDSGRAQHFQRQHRAAIAAPALNASPSAAAQPEAKESPAATPQPDTSSAALIAQVVEEAKHSSRPLSTCDPSNTPKLFIEVGTFKDENWANHAVEKLTQLGFHAVTIHKGVLWSQSYHVQVGPYATQQEIAEARTSLVAQGFKAHPVN